MDYIDTNTQLDSPFLPPAEEGEKIFYGTQHVYCIIRFYYTLYERFAKAREISQEFEDNEKTNLLSQAEKESIAEERYTTFKWVLVHLLRSNIDNEKYEDLLRGIFGNKAYLMFYIDKIVHSVIISIQKLFADDITLKTLNLFTESDLLAKSADQNKAKANGQKSKNWPEQVHLAQLNQLTGKYINNLQNTTFFRFVYNLKTQVISINLHESPYKDWKDKNYESIIPYSKAYLQSIVVDNSLKNSKNPVFLRRNKEINRKKAVVHLPKIVQENNIEWKYLPNTQKLVTDKINQEECLFIVQTKTNMADELQKRVYSQYEKLRRFKAWYKKTAKF